PWAVGRRPWAVGRGPWGDWCRPWRGTSTTEPLAFRPSPFGPRPTPHCATMRATERRRRAGRATAALDRGRDVRANPTLQSLAGAHGDRRGPGRPDRGHPARTRRVRVPD